MNLLSHATLEDWYIINGFIAGKARNSLDGVRDGEEITIGPVIAAEGLDGHDFCEGTVLQTPEGIFALGQRLQH